MSPLIKPSTEFIKTSHLCTHMDANSKSLKSKLKKLHNVCEMEKSHSSER